MKKLFGGLCLLSTSFMLFGCKKSVPEATKPKMNEFFVYEGELSADNDLQEPILHLSSQLCVQ